jgi:hypothetical protein
VCVCGCVCVNECVNMCVHTCVCVWAVYVCVCMCMCVWVCVCDLGLVPSRQALHHWITPSFCFLHFNNISTCGVFSPQLIVLFRVIFPQESAKLNLIFVLFHHCQILNFFRKISFYSSHNFFFFYSLMHTMFGSFLPTFPHSLPYLPLPQAETILSLSLILLKREYKQ